MVDAENTSFSKKRQCELLGIHRSGLYYEPVPVPEEDLRLMQALDLQYMETPFYGRRRMVIAMRQQGFEVGQAKIRTAMKIMGLEAIYPKPNLSKSHPEHKKYPYLLKGVIICRPDQVWAADITYIPVSGGFGYLFAIMDWYSRYIIEWQVSNLLDADFCIEALERALSKRQPEIFNTDQGVQFTCFQFIEQLKSHQISISMDGRGRAFDNIMVERLWRSVKYENIYPRAYRCLKDVKNGLTEYIQFYNEKRPHQGLKNLTPKEMYHGKREG